MGIYDREYYQDEAGPGRFSFGSIAQWPWSYKIIALSVVIFFLDHLIPSGGRLGGSIGPFTTWGVYSTSLALQQFQIWRLLTHLFVNPDPQSLLFSMLMLFFFGPPIESALGRPKFLLFYLLCGVGAALLGSLICPALYGREPLIAGAWGSLMGLIIAAGVLTPQQTVIFMFVLPMTMQTLAILSVVIGLAFAVSGVPQSACSLGGAAIGYLLIKNRQWLGIVERIPGMRGRSMGRSVGGPAARMTVPFKSIVKAFEPKPVSEDELDRLLDKVHEQGIDSLTASEKATLKRASKQRRPRSF